MFLIFCKEFLMVYDFYFNRSSNLNTNSTVFSHNKMGCQEYFIQIRKTWGSLFTDNTVKQQSTGGKVSLCFDFRGANRATIRDREVTLTGRPSPSLPLFSTLERKLGFKQNYASCPSIYQQ